MVLLLVAPLLVVTVVRNITMASWFSLAPKSLRVLFAGISSPIYFFYNLGGMSVYRHPLSVNILIFTPQLVLFGCQSLSTVQRCFLLVCSLTPGQPLSILTTKTLSEVVSLSADASSPATLLSVVLGGAERLLHWSSLFLLQRHAGARP